MKNNLLKYSGFVAFWLGILAVLALTAQITLLCDDYWYGTFFRGGLSGFWEETVWHYCNFNGRAFVHFIDELVLLFDRYLYIVLCPAMLAFIFIMGQRLQGRENPWWTTLLTSGAGALAVVSLPLGFLRSSLMWISAGFNYIFPLCVLFLALWLFQRNFSSPRAWIGVEIAAFLAGATTEQIGFAAMIALCGWGLLSLIRRQLPFWKAALPGALSCVGYATVVFAPGTWVRVGREMDIGGGVLALLHRDEFRYRLQLSMRFFTGQDGIPALFLVFAVLFGLWLGLRKHNLLWAIPGVGAAAVYLLLIGTEHYFIAELFTVLTFAAAGIYFLFRPETTNRGLLLFGMLGAQLIMLLNRSACERTTLPAILLLLIVGASILADSFTTLRGFASVNFSWAAPAVTACIFAALLPCYLPTLIGYAKNIPVVQANEKEWRDRSDDVVRLNMDLDSAYSMWDYYTTDKFFIDAIEYYGVIDQSIAFYSEDEKFSGLQGTSPGLFTYIKDDKLYLPIASSLRVCGGSGDWNYAESGIVGLLEDKSYLITNGGKVLTWDAENEKTIEEVGSIDIYVPYYTHYTDAETFCELFDLELEYDPDENVYHIRQKGES